MTFLTKATPILLGNGAAYRFFLQGKFGLLHHQLQLISEVEDFKLFCGS
jgi:hypothetical protein